MKIALINENEPKLKRKAKGVRTHIRRLKQAKSSDAIIATPKKKVVPKNTQEKG